MYVCTYGVTGSSHTQNGVNSSTAEVVSFNLRVKKIRSASPCCGRVENVVVKSYGWRKTSSSNRTDGERTRKKAIHTIRPHANFRQTVECKRAKPRFTYSRRQPWGSPAQVVVVNIVPPPVHTQNTPKIFVQIYSYRENSMLNEMIFPARVRCGTPLRHGTGTMKR